MLKLQNIRVEHADKRILDGIDLSINPGDKVWLHGPSGSGKSTLLKVLFCAEYFTGRVLFHNQPVGAAGLVDYRSHLGFISQRIPDFDQTAEEVLHHPFHFRANRHRAFPLKRSRELLEEMRFDPQILGQRFTDLSGGEKQRLMVLVLLLIDRPVFLLDEVTAALDPRNIDTVVRLLTSSPDHTVVAVSHNTEWQAHANRSLVMESGRLREVG